MAPSACNYQAWKIINVIESTILEEYSTSGGASPLISKAGRCLVVCYKNDIYSRGRMHYDYIQSASALIQNMLLLFHSNGIGACWICDLPKQNVSRKIFKIPKNYSVIACIIYGYTTNNILNSNTKQHMIFHYGDEKNFKLHKRKYSYEQIVSNNFFEYAKGDCESGVYPSKFKDFFLVKVMKRNKQFIKNVLKRSGLVKR